MKILFDLLYIQQDGVSGIKLYAYKLINGICAFYKNVEIGILIWDNMADVVKAHIYISKPKFYLINHLDNNGKNKLLPFVFVCKYLSTLKELKGYDICISPCANDPFVILSSFVPHVGVVHDLQQMKHLWSGKNKFIATVYTAKWFYQYRKLTSVITISNTVAIELKNFCRINSTVIYNSIVNQDVESITNPIKNKNDKYILDINTFARYKNASTLIEAFDIVKKRYSSLRLVLKGNKTPYVEELKSKCRILGITDCVEIITDDLSKEEILKLYKGASIFVSPSFMEGFGLTPAEAVIECVPVIASDIPTLREILGDCADYFNPKSPKELSDLLLKHLDHPLPSTVLADRAREIKDKYSERKQLEKFDIVIKEIISQNKK